MKYSGKTTEQKKTIKAAGSLILSFLLCMVVIFVWVSMREGAFAWFSSNKKVETGGMSFSSDRENILFLDKIKATRNFPAGEPIEYLYQRDKDGIYYRWDSSLNDGAGGYYLADVIVGTELDEDGKTVPIVEKKREKFGFSGMIPTEVITITIPFHNYGTKSYQYSLDFYGIVGDILKIDGNNYSILGVYKVNGEFISTMSVPEGTTNVHLSQGTIAAGENAEATFTLSVDISQFNQLAAQTGASISNLLSEKSFSVSSIHLSFSDIALEGGA